MCLFNKYRKFHNLACLSLISVFFQVSSVSAAVSRSCQDAWNNWSRAYTGTTPFHAIQASSEWPILKSQVSEVLARASSVDIPVRGVVRNGTPVTKISLNENYLQRYAPNYSRNVRDELLARSPVDVLAKTRPKELVILFVGQVHAIDVYFQSMPREALYVFPRVRASSRFAPGSFEHKKFSETNAFLYELYLQLLHQEILKGRQFKLAQLVEQQELPVLQFMVLGDLHPLKETGWIDEMPSGECLRQMGFTGVMVGIEGADAHKNTSIQDMNAFLKSHGLTLDSRPGLNALFNKIQGYKKTLQVRMRGIDNYDL